MKKSAKKPRIRIELIRLGGRISPGPDRYSAYLLKDEEAIASAEASTREAALRDIKAKAIAMGYRTRKR